MARVLTAIIGIPLILAAIYYGPGWLFAGLVAATAALALDEFLRLSERRGLNPPGRWFLVLGAGVTAAFVIGSGWVIGFLLAAGVVPLVGAAGTGQTTQALDRLSAAAGGVVFVSVPLGCLILLTRPGEVLLLLGIVWAGDTAAYYFGRAFGHRPLAPRLSPHKTVEGAVAGLAASVLVAAGTAAGGWMPASLAWLAVVGATTGLAAQTGDLAESALKRSAGVKDSSSRIPGHGGVLDRVDGFLLAAPVFLLLVRL